jgi:hypothetical protein
MTAAILTLAAVFAVGVYLARISRCMEADFNYKLDLLQKQENHR